MQMIQDSIRRLGVALACLLLGGCYMLQSASEPVPSEFFPAPQEASGLVVMLPGFGDGPQDFVDNGFVANVQDANPAFDVLAVNAHFGYYRNYTVIDRLHQDVIEPIAGRYDEVWIVGISMGGFGAAAYAQEHSGNVDGLILLAPFMGSEEVVEDVLGAATLEQWQSPDLAGIEDVKKRRFYELWQFYQGYVNNPDAKPRLYLGFGDEDHLRPPNAFVADVLPANQSLMLPGGHKWSVWKPLFADLVERTISE